jgi:hypothetical protein
MDFRRWRMRLQQHCWHCWQSLHQVQEQLMALQANLMH